MEITEPVAKERLKDVIDFINEWKESGDVTEACRKFNISTTVASRILKGKAKPKTDFLKYLKDKALKNYNKLRI